MNELKSYTEYAVSTPTADFVIGFDFNYGEDAVNVTVDDVPAIEAGYTVVYLNETTIQLSPSVPSGVVRLQRETDIDQTDHAYRAGAKFIAQTMDENFEQLRHSQQEVRDGFVKLSDDTYEIIDTLNDVGQSAQDAADAAEVAAALANNAAAQVNDKVSYADFNNKPHNAMLARDAASAHPTSSILDASGETQQQVNYNGGSKWHSRVGGYKENERVVLANGDIVKSTIDENANDPNVDMSGWEKTGIQSPLNVLTKSISRSMYDHVADYVNIKDYGAIGDGTLHTVQEWINSGKFSSLADIQIAFPEVSALTDSIDWAVTQLCLRKNKAIYAPKGVYVVNRAINTPHSGSPNRLDTGAVVFGDGSQTIFTRLESSQVATRSLLPNGNLDINSIDDINNQEAVFSVHGCYFKFVDFTIQNSKVGFYFGQDLTKVGTEPSACYKNIIRDVEIRRCGTGVIMSAAYGNHYNDISNIHFIENQIDCEMRSGKYDLAPNLANNNRNYFTNIRSNRSIVGLWCSSGDTNRFMCWDGEGCGASPVNNPYPIPVGLPKLSGGVTQITNAVHVFDGKGQLNKLINCQMEACDIELYNNHYRNNFINCGYHEAVENGTQVYNLQEPGVFISHNTFFTPSFSQLNNLNVNAFPNMTELGFNIRGNSLRNNTGVSRFKVTNTSKNYNERRVFDLGSAAAGSTKTVTIWRDVDPSSSANIKVKVSALSTASNLSFANEIAVTAYRTSARSLTRYFMQELYKLRATGQGVGDSTNVIVPTIAHGGASTRELVLTLTMPSYAIDSVFVEVELSVSSV